MSRPLYSLIAAVLLTLGSTPLGAQRYTLKPAESQFWLDGTSTLGVYHCKAKQAHGEATVDEDAKPQVSGTVILPVASFDCGKGQMNRDLYEALKGNVHPSVRFTVSRAEVIAVDSDTGGWERVRAWGTLELAGTRRPLLLEASGKRLPGGRVQVRGQHSLRMTDFGVQPPQGLLGLVRAHDRVVVRFELIAESS